MESKVQQALKNFSGELAGRYYPLKGMTKDVQNQLIEDHFLFKEGDRYVWWLFHWTRHFSAAFLWLKMNSGHFVTWQKKELNNSCKTRWVHRCTMICLKSEARDGMCSDFCLDCTSWSTYRLEATWIRGGLSRASEHLPKVCEERQKHFSSPVKRDVYGTQHMAKIFLMISLPFSRV